MTIRTNAERGHLLAILLSAVTLVLEIAGGILSGSLALLSDAVHMLLDLLSLLAGKVSGTIHAVEGVDRVHRLHRLHRLHLWSLCSHIPVLSAHVEISPSHALRRGEVLEAIQAELRRAYHIEHVTLQPECGLECTLHTAPALRHGSENPNTGKKEER